MMPINVSLAPIHQHWLACLMRLACSPPVTIALALLLANFMPSTSDDPERGLNWTRRGQAKRTAKLSFFGRNNGQNFQCPPPLIVPHILFFEY
jgi:hypothetical protein